MLSEDKIIALYCIVDDILKAMHHQEDKRVRVSDSEVITTAFVAVLYFGGHLEMPGTSCTCRAMSLRCSIRADSADACTASVTSC